MRVFHKSKIFEIWIEIWNSKLKHPQCSKSAVSTWLPKNRLHLKGDHDKFTNSHQRRQGEQKSSLEWAVPNWKSGITLTHGMNHQMTRRHSTISRNYRVTN